MRFSVIGAANVDIGARCAHGFIPGDSNIGKITVTYGGVARNVAQDLRLLGHEVSLLAAFGNDAFGAAAYDDCVKAGLDLSHAWRGEGTSSAYVFVCDNEGEMRVAVSDMDIAGQITPSFLERNRAFWDSADAVVFETNLSQDSVGALVRMASAPLYVDTVSCEKAKKLLPVLQAGLGKKIHSLKTNVAEAQVLTGGRIRDGKDALLAAEVLQETGIGRCYLTAGKHGVYVATAEESFVLPAPEVTVVSATGAGDAFLAGVADGAGESARVCAMRGMAVSTVTLAAPGAVNTELCRDRLQNTEGRN